MPPMDPNELQRLLLSPQAEDRAALLRFAREAPLVYGWWRGWKWLFKQAQARPDRELLGVLFGRLDAVPLQSAGPDPLQANPAKLEKVLSFAVVGFHAFVLLGGSGERQNLRVYDLSDPVAPIQVAARHFGQATRIAHHDSRLFVFTSGGWRSPSKVNVLDVSNPAQLHDLGQFESPAAGAVLLSGPHGFLLQRDPYTSDPNGLTVLDLTAPGLLERLGFVALESPVALAVSGTQALVLCRQNARSPIQIASVDVSDPAQPQVKQKLNAPDALGIDIQGSYAYVAAGQSQNYYGQPSDPQGYGLRVIHLAAGLLAAIGLQAGQMREAARLDLGNARAVRVRGQFAYVAVSHQGSIRAKNFRPGGLRIVDIADPEHPRLVGSLDGFDAQNVTIEGTRAYVGTGPDTFSSYYGQPSSATLRIVDITDPARPLLIGTAPSPDTFAYLKRRARRALRSLAQTDPDAYAELAYETLVQSGRGRDGLDLAGQWISAGILFGGTGRYRQPGHGRGRYRLQRPGLSLRTRDERSPEAWDRHPDLAAGLFAHPGLPWQTQEMALKVLRAGRGALPSVPAPALARFLQSPSPLLITVAVRQVADQLARGEPLEPALVAEAFFFGNARLRRRFGELLTRHAKPAWWGLRFAQRLFERATADSSPGSLSRRQVGAAAYAARHFPDSLAPDLLLPVFAAVLATGQEDLTAWARDVLGRLAPAGAPKWLEALAGLADPAREPYLAALRAGLRHQVFDYPAAWALVQAETAWVREQGWLLLAESRTEPATLARIWGELLDSPQETPALETAFASPDALGLLRQAHLDGEALVARLESRPFLVRLLSGPAFSLVAQTVPAALTLQLIAAMDEAQWGPIRAEFLQALQTVDRLGEFWHAVWTAIGEQADPRLETRLLADPAVAGSFLAVGDPSFVETTTNPVFGSLLGLWVQAHAGLFLKGTPLLLAAATHQLPAVREWGLRQVRALGMDLPFALRLLESELPASVAAGRDYFDSAPAGDPRELEGAIALCDSPKASVRAWGRSFVDRRWENLPTADVLRRLAENPDPQTQAFLAARLRVVPAAGRPDAQEVQAFDRQVLRARDRGRRAKELVKARHDRPPDPAQEVPGRLDAATLLEMARSRTPRDAEWALGQLARLALEGQEVEGLTLDGPAGV